MLETKTALETHGKKVEGVWKYLDCSTSHIFQSDMEMLNNDSDPVIAYPNEYGAFVYVPILYTDPAKDAESFEEYIARYKEAGYSDAFLALMSFAHGLGCQWIKLDGDGTEHEALQICRDRASFLFGENPGKAEGPSEEELLIEAAGYTVTEDCDQEGLWVWYNSSEGCDMSLASEEEALTKCYKEIASSIMGAHDLSDEEWDQMPIKAKIALAKEMFGDVS